MMEFVWWLLLVLMAVPYVVYPVLMKWFFGKKKLQCKDFDKNYTPFVSIVMSVYNEESILEEKLSSIFAAHYPFDRMEVLVGSDASTDRTFDILSNWAKQYPNLRIFPFEERRGKISVINDLVCEARGEIIISTDAKAIFLPFTIPHLVRWFVDPQIGMVGGLLINPQKLNAGIIRQEHFYMENEMKLKYNEAVAGGLVMGVYGALYAIRKEIFPPVPPNLMVDDFFITLKTIEKKYKVIIDPEAQALEKLPVHLKEEFRRKVRIATGNFQNLRIFWRWLLTPWKKASLFFICHKVLRWTVPFLMLTWLVLSFGLVQREFYSIVLVSFLITLTFPLLDWILNRFNLYVYAIRLVTHFYSMNFALLVGCLRSIFTKIERAVWEPSKR